MHVESQKNFAWKRSSSATVNLTLPSPPINHVPVNLTYASFKNLQGW